MKKFSVLLCLISGLILISLGVVGGASATEEKEYSSGLMEAFQVIYAHNEFTDDDYGYMLSDMTWGTDDTQVVMTDAENTIRCKIELNSEQISVSAITLTVYQKEAILPRLLTSIAGVSSFYVKGEFSSEEKEEFVNWLNEKVPTMPESANGDIAEFSKGEFKILLRKSKEYGADLSNNRLTSETQYSAIITPTLTPEPTPTPEPEAPLKPVNALQRLVDLGWMPASTTEQERTDAIFAFQQAACVSGNFPDVQINGTLDEATEACLNSPDAPAAP